MQRRARASRLSPLCLASLLVLSIASPSTAQVPGEIQDVSFVDADNVVWTPEGTAAFYNVYRGVVADLPAGLLLRPALIP